MTADQRRTAGGDGTSQGEVVFKLPRGNRGALIGTLEAEGGVEFVKLHQLYPDETTGEMRSTRGFRFKLAELAAVGALFTGIARSIEDKDKKNAAAAEKKAAETPVEAPAVEVLPKKAAIFVGVRLTAKRGGPCLVCGSQVVAGQEYFWSDERRGGAHIACGKELPSQARPSGKSAPRKPSPVGPRRQPQDDHVGQVSDEERKLAEEVF